MPGAITQANNPANDPDLKPVKGHSKFKPNMSLYKTHRYGMIEPHFALEVVPDDKKVSYRSGSDVDTQNLKAPLMTPVKMNKDTFFVPLRAILPHNADLLITNPLTGQDIIPENVNCVLDPTILNDLVTEVGKQLVRIVQGRATSAPTPYADSYAFFSHSILRILSAYQLGSPLLSYGSLAQSLGYNFAACYYGFRRENGTYMTFDESMDVLFRYIRDKVTEFTVEVTDIEITGTNSANWVTHTLGVDVRANENDIRSSRNIVTLRSLLELVEQGAIVTKVYGVKLVAGTTDIAFPLSSYGLINDPLMFTCFNIIYTQSLTDTRYYNLSRLAAYQILCASFYTDDAVDYVYTAKLWHQNMKALHFLAMSVGMVSTAYYNLNGVTMEYDSVSGAIMSDTLNYLIYYHIQKFFGKVIEDALDPTYSYAEVEIDGAGIDKGAVGCVEYYLNLFGYQRSLRYRDYFVGSRVAPLAVGDVSVAVNNNVVDVVDVTKNIQMQRFLNQVNRIGRRIKEYSAGIFGVTPRTETDEPIYLSSVTVTIGAEETSNTGEAQLNQAQTTTSKLRKDTSSFIFSSDFNEYGVVIGVTTFDAVRPLPDALDKQLLHVDRFDMFNPFMQHVGDQDVAGVEIHPVTYNPFGYKLRYSEYKQRTDRIAGGFSGSYLPGFCFATDANDLGNPLSNDPLGALHISPDFIRIKPHEFDKFFNVLPYDSLAGYFHFIIRHDNEVDALRPMEAAPSIL